ncbi:MAG TPA: glycogen-binding domain-containing protein, partial [Polyangiaceae bacterium]|nr:glycogen-binding domain-containing protein [Polyangiaceae bacterium]
MPPRSRPVTFRFHDPADHPVGHVELLGEPQDWLHPIPMRRSADPPSDWVAQLDLPEGVYSFKFRADGDWQLAGDATRTRSRWGHRNQIVSVGSTLEPLLFAPAAPWLFVDLDGALVVTAALRKGASTRLMVLWGERGDLDHAQEASAVFEED